MMIHDSRTLVRQRTLARQSILLELNLHHILYLFKHSSVIVGICPFFCTKMNINEAVLRD